MLDGGLAHHHDQATRRIAERAACSAGVALGTGPDLLLHRIVDAFEILGPKQLHNLARAEIVVMRRRARCRANATVQATVELMVEPEVALNVLEDFLQLFTFNRERVRYRITNEFLDSGR